MCEKLEVSREARAEEQLREAKPQDKKVIFVVLGSKPGTIAQVECLMGELKERYGFGIHYGTDIIYLQKLPGLQEDKERRMLRELGEKLGTGYIGRIIFCLERVSRAEFRRVRREIVFPFRDTFPREESYVLRVSEGRVFAFWRVRPTSFRSVLPIPAAE